MSLPFLLEIGCEEIPDWMILPALGSLRMLFATLLDDHRLGGEIQSLDATPRRLVIRASNLIAEQAGESKTTLGPNTAAGPAAAQGFARKMAVPVEQLEIVSSAKGQQYSFTQQIAGHRTIDILSAALPVLIPSITFPKTMYWTGKGGIRFIRPIRWIVALLGENVVPFELAGVASGSTTSGHRRLGASQIPVTVDDYEDQLRRNAVILSAAERRALIEAGLDAGVRPDPALLDTLVYLTECPATIRGTFDSSYLELPEEILSTVMRHHQRYFSVQDDSGKLAPQFVAVMNTSADPEGLVRLGNERVLRARFNDARFFWDVDQHRKLSDRVENLASVTFQAKLGSYLEKTDRVAGLAREIASLLKADVASAERAARLAKCDLTTEMVKEFTELQGIVGGLYARQQGEPEPVWRAIYEHYKPLSMEDAIPATRIGQVVALADKLDTLRGCFGINLIPKGSGDPFALRRAAQGVVKILVEGGLRLHLSRFFKDDAQLEDFFRDRVEHYFREVRGFHYDEVNAALTAGSSDLVDALHRLEALRAVRSTPGFESLAASFKRIQNILAKAPGPITVSIDPELLEPGPETELHSEFLRVREQVQTARAKNDYQHALEAIASLRPRVDRFFDAVLVNAPDERLRKNRLALLKSMLTEFSSIADFSQIVTSSPIH